jgi:hypothetical protein
LTQGAAGRIGTRYVPMVDWLDEHCGVDGWSITPAGGLAAYVNTPVCALAFVERWLVPSDDPSGFYELRHDEPAKRVPLPPHKRPA